MSGSGKKLYIGIPFSSGISSTYSQKPYELNLVNLYDTAFAEIKSANLSTALPLSSLNYLNRMEMGHFYSIVNSATTPGETYLLAYYILSNSQINSANVPNGGIYDFPNTFTPSADTYSSSGDKLCWGSVSEGIVIISFKIVSNSSQRKLPTLDCLDRNSLLLALLPSHRSQRN